MYDIIHNRNDLRDERRHLRRNMTPQEHILWSKVRGKQLGHRFRRQDSIGPYIVDFYCAAGKLIVEIDGNQHNEEQNKLYDLERTKFLNDLGYIVLRFSNNEISSRLEAVLKTIQLTIEARP